MHPPRNIIALKSSSISCERVTSLQISPNHLKFTNKFKLKVTTMNNFFKLIDHTTKICSFKCVIISTCVIC